ncbi:glucokinase [Endozoicomonas sp. SCSIO W0465]|uniref:glucokinase n=1 Tax=Endozoicomonas sp. SCSIO W0465 TaxID=2918516 RepID=UPI002074F710|nr:glucokinase [Endozoicomonas sp. SCSIO W0465]USE34558.1 glucokinase [Endozoicomonas sp. SCSIO W0465]
MPTPNSSLALVADIGGTNARFALSLHGQLQTRSVSVLACNDFENLDHAVQHYLKLQHVEVDDACMAFACPVNGQQIKMTNNHWAFDKFAMKATLRLRSFKVINDFTAQALALPALPEDSLIKVGSGEAIDGATKLIIGPGTGLGVAALKQVGDHWLPLPGEGGHAALSPVSSMDNEIHRILQQKLGYVSWESVLCGSGIELLYEAHSELSGQTQQLRNHEITAQALNGESLCKQTLLHFCELLGRAASNAALTTGAQGGVYIAGGIIPRFPDFFAQSDFRTSFDVNDKMASYLAAIPTSLIIHDNPGLTGACEALGNPLIH